MHLARLAILAVATALPSVSMTTCVDIEHVTTLMPDGSGRFVLSVTGKSDEKEAPSADKLFWETMEITRQSEGFSAWKEPTFKRQEKMLTFTLTGYFEDINKIAWYDGPPGKDRKLKLSFTYRKKDTRVTLSCDDDIVAHWKKESTQPLGKEDSTDRDDRYMVTFQVPGKITKSHGFLEVKDRTAVFRVDEKQVLAARRGDADAVKALEQLSETPSVSWTTIDLTAADVETFKKEFATARQEWPALRARWEKLRQEAEGDKDD